MNNPIVIANLIWGIIVGFVIEVASSIGMSWLVSPIYLATGIELRIDPFLFEYPLIAALLLIGYLSLRRKAYAMSVGVVCGYLLGTLVLMFMLWGA
jgi:hypothetical protein